MTIIMPTNNKRQSGINDHKYELNIIELAIKSVRTVPLVMISIHNKLQNVNRSMTLKVIHYSCPFQGKISIFHFRVLLLMFNIASDFTLN